MNLLKNPFNVEKDIDEVVDELKHENSSAEKTFKLFAKIVGKGLAGGAIVGVGLGTAALAAVEIGRRTHANHKSK